MNIVFSIYFIILICFALYVSFLFLRDRDSYMKIACKRLFTTILCMENEIKNLDTEIEKLYMGYSINVPSVKKVYPNVVTWLEDILYRINANFGYAKKLKPYIKEIKEARDLLYIKYPFYECEKYQQEILNDLKKIEKRNDVLDQDIIVENLISRIQGEFLRLNVETGKNLKINIFSLFVTVISIIVTIISIVA